ncbi:MAG: YHYH domain-containing protein [Mesorhizobium sp.]|nr:YHYH domain-containing protein [Mesorhizobium sp. M8A.F.Ca.ET.023.02.2.1]RWC75334.1 MAG: YHYH domain-containing protein [Mesorhizobium sp.]TIW76807.1 MAG: YHYH domain-containing protein [Mesorhizobium sp.]
MKYSLIVACLLSSIMGSIGVAAAHSGGTDANGCHTNHQTGEYHCH